MTIIYRNYQPGDEKQIVKTWNECLSADPITLKRFRNLILLDANFDEEGLILAFNNDELIGAIFGVVRKIPLHGDDLETENGWISFFFVKEEMRSKGVGHELMVRMQQFYEKRGRKNIFFSSYAPNYIVPGIDVDNYKEGKVFLEKEGFERLYSACAMDYSLVNFKLNDEINRLKEEREQEGYIFRNATSADVVEAVQFANDLFNPDWGRAIREGLVHGAPLSNLIIARDPQGKLVGFCIYGCYEGIQERFGPFGVDPSIRGKGLGKILLNICLLQMRAEGLHNAWFLWTGEKTPAGYLYKKTGFEITREFDIMRKTLK